MYIRWVTSSADSVFDSYLFCPCACFIWCTNTSKYSVLTITGVVHVLVLCGMVYKESWAQFYDGFAYCRILCLWPIESHTLQCNNRAAYTNNIAQQFPAKQKLSRVPVTNGTCEMLFWLVTLFW